MTKRDNRPVSAIQSAKANSRAYFPPITTPSSSRVEGVYAGVLSAIPSSQRAMTSARIMALELAEAVVQCERLSIVLQEQGDFYICPNRGIPLPHPAAAIRHSASMRISTLIMKLRLTPSADARELQRAGAYEAEMRGHASLSPPVANDGPAPDWAAMLKEGK